MNNVGFIVLGAIMGGSIMALMWWLDGVSYHDYLVRKAQPETRSALRLRGQFVYLIPEREYVALKLRACSPKPLYQEDEHVMGPLL